VQITSDALPDELQGTVDRIGLQVRRQSVVNTDPSTNIDGRVVEVHVRLDKASNQKAAQLTNLQVKAVIAIWLDSYNSYSEEHLWDGCN